MFCTFIVRSKAMNVRYRLVEKEVYAWPNLFNLKDAAIGAVIFNAAALGPWKGIWTFGVETLRRELGGSVPIMIDAFQ